MKGSFSGFLRTVVSGFDHRHVGIPPEKPGVFVPDSPLGGIMQGWFLLPADRHRIDRKIINSDRVRQRGIELAFAEVTPIEIGQVLEIWFQCFQFHRRFPA